MRRERTCRMRCGIWCGRSDVQGCLWENESRGCSDGLGRRQEAEFRIQNSECGARCAKRQVRGSPARIRIQKSDCGATVIDIDREHPEYKARKQVWCEYRDLYAGGEQLKLRAQQYLVRRQ